MNRRQFLLSAGGAALGCRATQASAISKSDSPGYGVLVDTPECIGCRKCEYACAKAHAEAEQPVMEAYEDRTVFDHPRRMGVNSFTVVNRYPDLQNGDKPTYVKIQCMHCLEPACVSACLVGALRHNPKGDVGYEAWKCMGCRYCMVACPFQVPAYEYHDPLTPRVRKCDLCRERLDQGLKPACVAMCPTNCMTFAPREQLLQLAHEKIADNPDRYAPEVYGEKEVGGTGWLYLTSRPAPEVGMLALNEQSVTRLPESIQHNIFKSGLPPLILLGALGLVMRTFMHKDLPGDRAIDKQQQNNTVPAGEDHNHA